MITVTATAHVDTTGTPFIELVVKYGPWVVTKHARGTDALNKFTRAYTTLNGYGVLVREEPDRTSMTVGNVSRVWETPYPQAGRHFGALFRDVIGTHLDNLGV